VTEKGVSNKGVAPGWKVGGPFFLGPPTFCKDPPLFGGGHSKMWGGVLKVFLHSSVAYNGVVHYCRVWISHYWNAQGRKLIIVVWISIIGIHNEEIDLCLVDTRISLQFAWRTNIRRVTLQVYSLKTSACMGELYLTRLA